MQGTLHVSREVNLRDDVDIAFGSVADNLAALVLRVVASVGCAVVDAGIGANDGLLTNAALEGKAGEGFHLEAPALVFGQMPMELVASVQGHDVEHLLDGLDGEEVPGTVQQQAAIAEAGLILNLRVGQKNHIGLHQRQALAESLRSTEKADRLAGLKGDALVLNLQHVGFLLLSGEGGCIGVGFLPLFLLVSIKADLEADGGALVLRRQHQADSRCLLNPLLEEASSTAHLVVRSVVGNAHAALEVEEMQCVGLYAHRQGDDAIVGSQHLCFSAACKNDKAEQHEGKGEVSSHSEL